MGAFSLSSSEYPLEEPNATSNYYVERDAVSPSLQRGMAALKIIMRENVSQRGRLGSRGEREREGEKGAISGGNETWSGTIFRRPRVLRRITTIFYLGHLLVRIPAVRYGEIER